MPRQLKNLRIDDVSSVDRGAGRGVRVVLIKRDTSGSAIDKALDLSIRTALKAADPAESLHEVFKQFHDHLIEQENADMTITLDKDALTNLISEQIAKALKDAGMIVEKMTPEHAAYHQHLDGDEAKKFGAMGHDEREKHVKAHPIKGAAHGEHDDGDTSDHEPDGDDEMGKALALITKLGGKVTGLKRKEKNKDKEPPGEGEFAGATKEAMAKRDEELKKAQERNDELKKRVDALEDDKAKAEFAKRAVAMGLPEAEGVKLLKAHRGDPECLKWMEDTIAKQNKALSKSELFKSYGNDGNSGMVTAYDELVAKGAELRKGDPKLTVEQAFNKAASDPANAEIVRRERDERMARANGRA